MLADAIRSGQTARARDGVSFGDVSSVREDGTVDVVVDEGELKGIAATTACAGVEVGDRVMVYTSGRLSTVVGVMRSNSHYVSMRGDWYVLQLGNFVACWIPAVSPQFSGGNDFVRFYDVNFPVEFSDAPTVQVTKVNSTNSATELSERIELNGIWTDHAQVKCNAWQWPVPEGETTRFSILAVGVV